MTQQPSSPRLSRAWEAGLLLLITLLGAALRFYQLADIPPGLHFDEAFKGVTARALLQGAPPKLFFEADMGEEPMAIYLVAAALGSVGQEPWVVRLPSAIIGTLTIPLAWWLGRELARLAYQRGDGLQAQMLGLGTASVLAILYWHLSFSRIGMEPILVPFFAILAFAALAHGLNSAEEGKPSYPAFVLSGLALGGSLYTYKAGYFVPVVAALFVAYAALVERGFLRRHGRGLLVTGLLALLVAVPIVLYFATHPANFLQRPASVALTAGGGTPEALWPSLLDNVPRVLGMFFLQGDANPRSNLPGRPALDPFLALLFVVGLGRSVVGFRRPGFALLPIWLITMTLPTLVTEYAPHFGRAIGAVPALAVLCALGGMTLWRGATRLGWRWLEASLALLLGLGLVFSGISTAQAYFGTWARSPDSFYAYDEGLVQVADYVNTLPSDQNVYLTPTSRDHYTLQYAIHRPFASFDGRAGLVLPPPERAATVIVLLREDETTLQTLERVRPDGASARTWTDGSQHPYAMAYHLPPLDGGQVPALVPDHLVGASFDGAAALLGYSLSAEEVVPGDTLYLTLYWQSVAPMDKAYTVFTHLLGPHNPATNGPVWAGHDGQPDGGHYPTTAWQPGEVILDVHELTMPSDAPPGEYQLEVGLYLLATMARLPAVDAAGNALPGDAALLGSLTVHQKDSE